jgi:hypothetical protein
LGGTAGTKKWGRRRKNCRASQDEMSASLMILGRHMKCCCGLLIGWRSRDEKWNGIRRRQQQDGHPRDHLVKTRKRDANRPAKKFNLHTTDVSICLFLGGSRLRAFQQRQKRGGTVTSKKFQKKKEEDVVDDEGCLEQHEQEQEEEGAAANKK